MSTAGTAREFVDVVRDRNLTLLAAGVAYYAFVSFVPLLILGIAATSAFGAESVIETALNRVEAVSPAMATLLEDVLATQTGRVGASLAGTLVLVWSAIKVFRGIDVAFDEMYGVSVEDGLLEQVKNALIVLAAVVFAAVLMAGLAAALGVLAARGVPFPGLLSRIVLLIGLAVLLFPLYYVLPPMDVSVDHAVPGAALAAVGWVLLQVIFVYYASNAGQYAAYGVLGGILLFVTWLYAASIVLLSGAALNAVMADSEEVAPEGIAASG